MDSEQERELHAHGKGGPQCIDSSECIFYMITVEEYEGWVYTTICEFLGIVLYDRATSIITLMRWSSGFVDPNVVIS